MSCSFADSKLCNTCKNAINGADGVDALKKILDHQNFTNCLSDEGDIETLRKRHCFIKNILNDIKNKEFKNVLSIRWNSIGTELQRLGYKGYNTCLDSNRGGKRKSKKNQSRRRRKNKISKKSWSFY